MSDLTHVEARPGNVLVPVRKPGALTHLTAALRAAGDRDVVAMTVRLVGVDVPDDPSSMPRTTERRARGCCRRSSRWPSAKRGRCGC